MRPVCKNVYLKRVQYFKISSKIIWERQFKLHRHGASFQTGNEVFNGVFNFFSDGKKKFLILTLICFPLGQVLKRMGLSLGLERGQVSPEDLAKARAMLPRALEQYVTGWDSH